MRQFDTEDPKNIWRDRKTFSRCDDLTLGFVHPYLFVLPDYFRSILIA